MDMMLSTCCFLFSWLYCNKMVPVPQRVVVVVLMMIRTRKYFVGKTDR